jgi:peptide/nickel transport system substrate-binding protein
MNHRSFSSRWVGLFAFVPLLALMLAGCGGKDESSAPASSQPSAKAPAGAPPPEGALISNCEPGISGGRLVIATFGDPKTFNPITANESSSEDIIRFLFASLLNYDWVKQEVEAGIAESWSVAEDKKTWTFKLRKGVKWTDGAPLTADDVIFTWDVIYNPKIDNVTADLFKLDGKNFTVTKVDDLTVKVVTPDIYAPFLENFGSVAILPKHVLAKAAADGSFTSAYGINTKPADLVGSGPYKIKQFKPGEITLLERNPHYFVFDKKGQRLPYLENVAYTVVPDMNAMALRFLNGESDAHENVRPEDYERFKVGADKGKFQLLTLGFGLERGFLWFNLNTNLNAKTSKPIVDPKKSKWFREPKFRQAISYAIDRDSIVKSVYFGRAQPNFGFVSPGNKKWHNAGIAQYPYDKAKALSLLAELGIKDRKGNGVLEDADGNKIEFVLNTNAGNSVREKMSVLIQDDLKKLGITLVYQPVDFNALVDKINNTYDYDAILLGLGGGGTDPSSSMNVLQSSGFTHQWFPRQKTPATEWEARIDFLMNAQLKTLDFAERKKFFDEVQTILADQVPMIYTTTPISYAAVRNGLGNLRPTVLSSYRVTWNAEEIYIKKK